MTLLDIYRPKYHQSIDLTYWAGLVYSGNSHNKKTRDSNFGQDKLIPEKF